VLIDHNGDAMRQRTPPDPARLAPVAPWSPGAVAHVAGVADGPDVADVADPFGRGVAEGGAAGFGAADPGGGQPASPPDWYVVVDELDELGCRLAVDRWPDRDAEGRLVFDDGEQLLSVPPARLHEAVEAARTEHGDDAPERPLRIGDTFALWWGPLARDLLGLDPPPGRDDQTAPPVEVVDVTREARRATNAAAQATAGGVLTAAELVALDLPAPDDEVTGSGGGS
jgi:hypothetical protein